VNTHPDALSNFAGRPPAFRSLLTAYLFRTMTKMKGIFWFIREVPAWSYED
jgi:hypothetical protein